MSYTSSYHVPIATRKVVDMGLLLQEIKVRSHSCRKISDMWLAPFSCTCTIIVSDYTSKHDVQSQCMHTCIAG